MSAMSASSPPSGLMPLSLISEHKTSVPAVQPIPRTPEKMNQQPPNTLQQLPPQVQQPLGMKLPAGVANGMEAPQPPVPFPHQPQESVHPPVSIETSGSALPPTSHLPNLPSGSKGEVSGPAKIESASAPGGGNSCTAEPIPAPAAPEVPAFPEIRLPMAPGLTIMPIGIPMSQPSLPLVVPPSTAPVEPAQPHKEVLVTQVASVPPSVPVEVGTANVAAARPAENREAKPAPPERAQEKKPAGVPSEAVESTATPQPAAPAPSSLGPPPVIRDAAQAPPPAPKPVVEPVKAPAPAVIPSPAQTPQLAQQPPAPAQPQPPVTPAKETPPTPPVEQAKTATVAAQPPAATPAPSAAPAAQEAPSSQPSQPAASQAAPEPSTVAQSKPKRTPKPKLAPDVEKKTPAKETPSDKDNDGKPRRKRLPTQPYQSPIPELNLIAKINKIDKTPAKPQEDKLIVFYRNEFLAVRNPEGSFYVCQAMQNIYKSSSKIKIRWLSQDQNQDENYTPDFYDHTEFDCILTNLNLQRVGKDQFKLPEVEAKRTDSILKRAIDVEKGIVVADESTITEEHPDGLDLSLYRNEEQLKKRKKKQKKPSKASQSGSRSDSSKRAKTATEPSKKLPARGRAGAKRKIVPPPATKKAVPVAAKKTSPTVTPAAATPAKKEPAKKEGPVTPAPKSAIKRKAAVAPASAPPADKRSRRDPTTKTKSGAVAASATGASTPKPPASSSLRRPTRNSK